LGIEESMQSNNTKMHENTNEKILTEKDSRKWQAREKLEKGSPILIKFHSRIQIASVSSCLDVQSF